MTQYRMPLSELRRHITEIIEQHGDLDVAITLPGWMIGAEEPEALNHSWEFGIYVLELLHKSQDGTEWCEKIASLGHAYDYEKDPKRHLTVVKD